MCVLVKRAPFPASRYSVALLGLVRPYPVKYSYIALYTAFLKIIKIYCLSYFSLLPLFLFYITGCPLRFSCAGLRPFLLAFTAYRRSLYPAFI